MGLEITDFYDLALSLSPGLLHAYSFGHTQDLSGNGIVSTVGGVPVWDALNIGYALQFRAGGLNLGDPASCRATTALSLMAFGNFARLEPDNGRIIAKRNGAAAATCDYDFYLTNTPNINLFDGVTTSTLAYDYRDDRSLALTVVDGAAPNFYGDGVPVGIGGNVIDVDDDGNTLRIGEREGNNDNLINPVDCILIYPDIILTGEQISDLHRLWIMGAKVGRADPKNPVFFLMNAPDDIAGTMSENFPMELDGDNESKGVLGASVWTVVEPVVGAPGFVNGRSLAGQHARDSRLDASNPATLINIDAGSIEVIATLLNDANTGYIVVSDANDRTRLYYAAGAAQEWRWQKGNPPANVNAPVNSARVGCPVHLLGTWWNDAGTRRMEFFLDGESIGTNTFLDTTIPTYLRVFYVAAANSFDGKVHLARTYSTRITPADARLLYLQYAVKPTILSPRYEYPISLLSVAAGGKIGPWDWIAGSFQWIDDGVRRAIEGTGNSTAVYPSTQVYGGWHARMEKPDAGRVHFAFLLSSRALLNDASQNGYELEIDANESVRLRNIRNGGIVANIVLTGAGYVAVDTEYQFYVSRRVEDALFSVYIRGGIYVAWTLVGTGIDAEHTVSNYTAMSSVISTSRMSDVIYFPLGGTIDPTAGDLDYLDVSL
jgi:hypothetical protein